MNSKRVYLCLIFCEIVMSAIVAVAVTFQWHVPAAPSTCRESRSGPTPNTLRGCSATPTPPISAPRTTLKPSTASVTRATGAGAGFTPGRGIVMEGYASWYDRSSCRREGTGGKRILMANGKPLDDNAMTAAMWIVGKHGRPLTPDGRLVRIMDVQTLRTVTVAWTDNGPGIVPRNKNVICDLTPRAMMELAGEDGIRKGKIKVRVQKWNE